MNKFLAGILLFCLVCFGTNAIACCSVAPAEFTHTVGWIGEFRKAPTPFHLLVYENIAKDLNPGSKKPDDMPGNAMLLPIPAISGSMSAANMLDGREFKGVVSKLYEDTKDPLSRWLDEFEKIKLATNGLNGADGFSPAVQVFTHGSYTVVLSKSAAAIPQAVFRVPKMKRPRINPKLLEAYDKWYPGWTFALCCFDSTAADLEPIAWWYQPRQPDQLFFPAVDEHSGNVPSINRLVPVDHRLVVTTDSISLIGDASGGVRRSVLPEIPSFQRLGVSPMVSGASTHFQGERLQGDFVFNASDLRTGIFRPLRVAPQSAPGANFMATLADMIVADQLFLDIKVQACLFLSALVLLYRRTWLPATFTLGGSVAVSLPFSWLDSGLRAQTVEGLFIQASFLVCLVVIALVVPFAMSSERRNLSPLFYCCLLFVILSAFVFSSYSAFWMPFAYALLFFGAKELTGVHAVAAAPVIGVGSDAPTGYR